jgi:hypothetical protein
MGEAVGAVDEPFLRSVLREKTPAAVADDRALRDEIEALGFEGLLRLL